MIERGPANELEMVLAFLRAELDSPRFGAAYQGILDRSGVSRVALIDRPDLGSRRDNFHRSELLRAVRGYGSRTLLFAGFPTDVAWRRVDLEQADLDRLRYANFPTWNNLSGGSRRVLDGARNVASVQDAEGTAGHVQGIVAQLALGRRYPELIAVAGADDTLVLLEGHTRATAHALVGIGKPVPVLVGCSASMAEWAFY